MIRQIIHIDQEKCNGCGLCVTACHEGAIALIGGKAYLAREHYCDGLGDCLPGCPTGAITFETREAPAYDEAAVLRAKAEKAAACLTGEGVLHCGQRPRSVRSQESAGTDEGQGYQRLYPWRNMTCTPNAGCPASGVQIISRGIPYSLRITQCPVRSWRRRPSGNRRYWHRPHSCPPCRILWRHCPHCGRCSP